MTYQRPDVRAGALRLHFNENTDGCSPAVLAALRSIGREEAAFYPEYGPITAKCEAYLGVPPGWVHLTNGLDEGLHVVAEYGAWHLGSDPAYARQRSGASASPTLTKGSDPAYARQGPTPQVLIVEPAFEMYAACAEAVGAEVVRVLPETAGDFEFPLARLLDAITSTTRVVYLTDPNNPTGLAIAAGAVETIASRAPQALVLVDEAYADFSGRTLIGPALDRHRNLIVGRTFAKAHGLAALRVGALIGHPETLDPLRRLLPPYSINICAILALGASLDDRAYVDAYVAQSAVSRDLIYAFCERGRLHYWPSQANFVLVRVGEGAPGIARRMADRGVLIRDKSGAPGCEGCVRITAGNVSHTTAALAALEDALASRAH
jgi:histidinol-phosphate aminotransferase